MTTSLVTMELIERAEDHAAYLDSRGAREGDATDLRALTSFARRIVEADAETVEKVAKAMFPSAWAAHRFSGDPDWHPQDDEYARICARKNARAALAAMVSP